MGSNIIDALFGLGDGLRHLRLAIQASEGDPAQGELKRIFNAISAEVGALDAVLYPEAGE